MIRKPIILIFTSRNESEGFSQSLCDSIKKVGTHNVIVFSDDKYCNFSKIESWFINRFNLIDKRHNIEKYDRNVVFRVKKSSRRIKRIKNALKRFNPEFVIAVTPFAHFCLMETKHILEIDVPVMYYMPSFTMENRSIHADTKAIIVENPDAKAELVKAGHKSKSVVSLGFPFEVNRLTDSEIATKKQELGIPISRTIFLSITDISKTKNILNMLLDQGDWLNIIVKAPTQKDVSTLRELISQNNQTKVEIVASGEDSLKYFDICDLTITCFDIATLYRSFRLGIPVIIYDNREDYKKDINFLVDKNLLKYSKDSVDVVELVYKMFQNMYGRDIAKNAEDWVALISNENIANYLVSYFDIL